MLKPNDGITRFTFLACFPAFSGHAAKHRITHAPLTVIEPDPDQIIPELLPFIIQNDSFFDYAVGKSAGSLSPRVKWEHLKNYEFFLPDTKKQQQELADLLWSIAG